VRAFVAYVLRGRTQAITVAALLATVALLLPMLGYLSGAVIGYFSGAVIGLISLRYGAMEGALVTLGAVALSAVFVLLVAGNPLSVVVFMAVTLLPVWLIAVVLRLTASQGMALLTAGLLGMVTVLGVHFFLADPAVWWRALLEQMIQRATTEGAETLTLPAGGDIEQILNILAPMMTGLMVAGTLIGLMLTVFLARWWHALVDNPGGFGQEFRALRIDRRFAPVAIVIALLAAAANQWTGGVALDLLWIVIILYLFQGLALMHDIATRRTASVGWLITLYVLLLLLPLQMILLLAVAGLGDTWLDLRTRFGQARH
jgi:hypothetical protein